ncbi:hypothetical protein M407DRAFT_22811 [Tulasnella calospora MUT 4182]|uniref:Uncharacterized protein n=1 Tax=Tulasnella calospora MUT 4182 TaxID=1051891 RepID=A0A0C3L2C5_9AGAM|nr:hypothetical protein M407DRAFT_22811 [Tulasnella calospora MUT 4182]
MSIIHDVQAFKGDSWEACSAFIRSIRAAAWKEGKLRDVVWMADLASVYLSDKALVWHSRLPEDVQEDWSKLQAAMIDRWSLVGDEVKEGSPDSPTTPRVVPLEKKDITVPMTPLRGILKVVVEGSGAVYYVETPINKDTIVLTDDVRRAFNVRGQTAPELPFLEWSDGPRYSWLGVHWNEASPNIGYGSASHAHLSVFNFEKGTSSRNSPNPFQMVTCTVSSSGEVALTWKKGETQIALAVCVVSPNIFIVADSEAFIKSNTQAKTVKLVIQQTD